MTDSLDGIHNLIDDFVVSVRSRDATLVDRLWGDGGFLLVGSEAGEIFRTRAELDAKFAAIFAQPFALQLDFPGWSISMSGSVAWVFLEGTLSRIHPDGRVDRTIYLASCIFSLDGDSWRWRQFFGSEPA